MRIDEQLKQVGWKKKEIKRLLKQGQVQVNGKAIFLEAWQVDGAVDCVTVAGKPQTLYQHDYYMLHKPAGVVCANKDAEEKTVFACLPKALQQKSLFTVGRLDKNTSGLLLLTNNGPLGYYLTQERCHVAKTYFVQCTVPLAKNLQTYFEQGIRFDDGFLCKPAQVKVIYCGPKKAKALVTLWEGKRHQVKKMFLACGSKVLTLKRLQQGQLLLDTRLKQGQGRPLTSTELRLLLDQYNQHLGGKYDSL